MIIITRYDITDEELDHIRERVEAAGLHTHLSRGERRTIIGCIGDEAKLQEVPLRSLPGVEQVLPVLKPYKLASKEFAANNTIVRVGANASIGSDVLTVIAGPCSVENRTMLHETAHAVQTAGATILRGGAFKPRSSPYSFQGLGKQGLELLAEVRAETGLPVVTEVLDTRDVDIVAEHADMMQVGARNMQNFALLAELGRVQRPVLLKRGLSATITELLMSANTSWRMATTRSCYASAASAPSSGPRAIRSTCRRSRCSSGRRISRSLSTRATPAASRTSWRPSLSPP